ncbi:acyl carrier protein [Streptomyces lancefieldiae]|uniref:Acyl carrier protein n=1 Tax=Streptomyces lancefieldiae TaxID=3075520 RepID=A0ABU3ALI9_9ACTN|nr:acyl carrier protein [Streptomyces sp. DSM 40712]MDT0610829.1 acyl carrier protein [Streptomyces sp. DSM 40712]
MTTNGSAGTAPTLREEEVRSGLLSFLETRTKQKIAPDQDIFADGPVTSLFAMELVVHLETTYGIEIAGPDLRIQHFRTVERLVALTMRLAGAGGSGDRD